MAFLKKLVNSVTGSWADVSVRVVRMTPGLARDFEAHIEVKEQPIEFARIVAVVRCTETARVRVSRDRDDDGIGFSSEQEVDSATVFEDTITLHGPGQFAAGHCESFTFPVAIPHEGPFSFKGRYVELEWECEVSIDMKGNDPDSGWQPFPVGSPL